jgi:hypothetical protein
MLQRHRVRDYESKEFYATRHDAENHDVSLGGTPKENMRGQRFRGDTRPHPWEERREEVIKNWGQRIKTWIEPLGYTGPTAERAELQDIVESQCSVHKGEHELTDSCQTEELAPEWLSLATNGVPAYSLSADYLDDEGMPQPMAEAIADFHYDTAVLTGIDDRQESFLREFDRRMWYSSRPKAAVWVEKDGKRGLAPKRNHPWTHEELKSSMACVEMPSVEAIHEAAIRRESASIKARRAFNGPRDLMSPEELEQARQDHKMRRWFEQMDPERIDFEEEDQLERIALSGEQRPYPAGVRCPDNCKDGEQVNDFDEDGDPLYETCLTCMGTGQVLDCIGFDDLPAIDPPERPYWENE